MRPQNRVTITSQAHGGLGRVLLERLVGLFFQFVCLELSIEVVKLAELFKDPIDLCHNQACRYQPDPVSSLSSS